MFEFKGELSVECKKRASRKEKMVGFICCSIPSLIFSVITIIISLDDAWALLFFIAWIYFPIIPLIPVNKKNQGLRFPNRIYIDENDVISESDKFHHEIPLDYIKSIKDFGQYYVITFICPTRESQFTCQKDLITIGTIEKFEEFFKDKILKL